MTIAPQFSNRSAPVFIQSIAAHSYSRRIVLRWVLAVQMIGAATLGLTSAQAQGMLSIDALGQSYNAAAKPLPASLSHLTLYRPANDGGADAVSVYIDGAYHTSLVKNGYVEGCVKPGTTSIGLRRVEGATDARNPVHPTPVTLKTGQQQFLRVSDQIGAQPTLQVVSQAQARTELAQTRQQIHTLSRAPSVVSCEEPPVTQAVVPAAPQVISLASDALFPFGKSGLNDMLQNGRVALDAVVNRVKTEYASVDSIRVIGHSDPIGRPLDKQIISSQRAQTVRDYISNNGLQSTQILSVGRADNELALNGCGNRATPANIECNAPNRRVAIEISGTRR
jgi:OOP family OmpA-OmpF porin